MSTTDSNFRTENLNKSIIEFLSLVTLDNSIKSVGAYVPYVFVYECLHKWVTTTGSLIGTKFKFTNDFVNSYQGNGWGVYGGPQEMIS